MSWNELLAKSWVTSCCMRKPSWTSIEYERELSVAYSGPFIDDVAPPSQKTLWFGILYLFPTVGIAVGYIFGGVIGASMGWRMPFLIQVSLML